MEEIFKFAFEKNKFIYSFLVFFTTFGVSSLTAFVIGVSSHDVAARLSFACFSTVSSGLFLASKIADSNITRHRK